MVAYTAPLTDMRFVLTHLVDLDSIAALPGYEAATPDLVDAILEEAGKLGAEVLAPLNHSGDIEGCHYENGVVRCPQGFPDAYKQYVESGWNSLPFDPDYGGQGMPWAVAFAVQEIWQSANMAFALCPLLNQGAVELLTEHGSTEQKDLYLTKLISGEWTGTMDLTEPQAGSDLSAVRTKAIRVDGGYRVIGQKIYITHGEHDMSENIIHMVLARLPDAPDGTRGISLFLVPKFLVNPDGSLGVHNDLRCAGIEHKLGIKASPTAVMSYGDNGGATAFLIGEEHRGIEYMFTMMNNARLSVGLQGIAIAERAYQQACAYARDRVQSRDITAPKGERVSIIHHPDVRRMLMTMRAGTEAARALAYSAGSGLDVSKRHPDKVVRSEAQKRVDLLTPVVKAWSSDLGVEIASLGIQVHGGIGFVEETGAAQHYRDARIAPIYEGTNGIHANDLVFRKIGRDGGAAARTYFADLRRDTEALLTRPGDDAQVIGQALLHSLATLETATDWVAERTKTDPRAVAAGAAVFLRLFGLVAGGGMMVKSADRALGLQAAGQGDAAYLDAKLIVARFYAEHYLPQTAGLLDPMRTAHNTVMGLSEEQL